MYKIYVQNKPLFLVDALNAEVDDYLHRPDTVFIDEFTTAAIKTMLHELEKPGVYAGVALHQNLDELLQGFKSQFLVIQAAGGLVYTNEKDVLFIFRKGKWDLPKGKVDEGEDLESCALREVAEETGATDLLIGKPIYVSYHSYNEKGNHILKESHWFLMKAENASLLIPQTEEDIEKCEWVPFDKIVSYTANMHASIIDVLAAGSSVLQNKNA